MNEMNAVIEKSTNLIDETTEKVKKFSEYYNENKTVLCQDEDEDEKSIRTKYTDQNIDSAKLNKYCKIIFEVLKQSKEALTFIQSSINKNALEINYGQFNRCISNALDFAIHKGSGFRRPIASIGASIHTIYNDKVTYQLQRIIERCDTELKQYVDRLLMLVKDKKIEALTVTYPHGMDKIGKKLIKIIKNNQAVKLIKISMGSYFDMNFLKNSEFYDAIDSATNLFSIEINTSFNEKKIKKFLEEGLSNHLKRIKQPRFFYFRYSDSKKNVFILIEPTKSEVIDHKYDNDQENNYNIDLNCIFLDESEREDYEFNKAINLFQSNPPILPHLIILLEQNEFLLTKSIEGWFLTDYAIRANNLFAFIYLNSKKASFAVTNKSETTLHRAIQYADVKFLLYILEQTTLINCLEYEDESGNTPLCIAAKLKGKTDILELLLQFGAKINHKTIAGANPVELAFENQNYKGVEILLTNGAELSQNLQGEFVEIFDQKQHPLYDYLAKMKDLHDAIERNDFQKIKKLIPKININTCRDLNNHTPLYNAVIHKKYDIYGFLVSIGAGFSLAEDESNPFYVLNIKDEGPKFQAAVTSHLKRYNDAVAKCLYSVTRTKSTNEKLLSDILAKYTNLLENELIKPTLEVIELCSPRLDIFVDFNADNIRYYVPSSSKHTMGMCDYTKSKVYISASGSSEEMLGTIAHEFTHQANEAIFKNKANPYPKGQSHLKLKFETIRKNLEQKVKNEGSNIDDIIKRVFSAYDEEAYDSELIVRVPHMLARYGYQKGKEMLEAQAPELLNFYINDFLPKCEEFIQNPSNLTTSTSASFYAYSTSGIKAKKLTTELDKVIFLKKCAKSVSIGIFSSIVTYGAFTFFKPKEAATLGGIIGTVVAYNVFSKSND